MLHGDKFVQQSELAMKLKAGTEGHDDIPG
jgi:hypothetical protein